MYISCVILPITGVHTRLLVGFIVTRSLCFIVSVFFILAIVLSVLRLTALVCSNFAYITRIWQRTFNTRKYDYDILITFKHMSSMHKNNVYVIQRNNHGLDVDHKVRVQSLNIGCNNNPTLLRDGT